MSTETLAIFVAMLAYVAAVFVKAAKCIVRDERYMYSRWDGGLMLAGKSLSKRGLQIKLVLASSTFFWLGGFAAGLFFHDVRLYSGAAIGLAWLISVFVGVERRA